MLHTTPDTSRDSSRPRESSTLSERANAEDKDRARGGQTHGIPLYYTHIRKVKYNRRGEQVKRKFPALWCPAARSRPEQGRKARENKPKRMNKARRKKEGKGKGKGVEIVAVPYSGGCDVDSESEKHNYVRYSVHRTGVVGGIAGTDGKKGKTYTAGMVCYAIEKLNRER
ncbi:hypothetical protein KQX54_005062 [Cotesia glomerata]|uniref:Uncharacterized protein n=1 Tax=Cotesia glomerata TaxID=32391 RepID=A0AAV7J5L9_COTGL|nr:hypothetical protein KQX54_005062 [Cotesia glomerata]